VAASERIKPEVPLPAPDPEAIAAALADVSARAAVSEEALPSCAFMTFVNTHHTLNCVAFAADGSRVVGEAGLLEPGHAFTPGVKMPTTGLRRRPAVLGGPFPMALFQRSFSDGRAPLAGGFSDSSVRIYDLRSGRGESAAGGKAGGKAAKAGSECTRLCGHSAPVFAVDYSFDQRLLFSASSDGTVRARDHTEQGRALSRAHLL
jgi:transcription initiation factor TFIID subunit 5